MHSVQSIAKGTDEALVCIPTVLDIKASGTPGTANLFSALCKAADVDGKWVGSHLSDIEPFIVDMKQLPEEELDALETVIGPR